MIWLFAALAEATGSWKQDRLGAARHHNTCQLMEGMEWKEGDLCWFVCVCLCTLRLVALQSGDQSKSRSNFSHTVVAKLLALCAGKSSAMLAFYAHFFP